MWEHIDPVVIERQKRKEERTDERPQIQLPMPEYYPMPEEYADESKDEKRGVYIIELI